MWVGKVVFIIVRVDEFTYWEIGLFPVKLILGVKPSRAAGAPGADIPASFKSLKAWPAEQSVGTDMWYWCAFCGLARDFAVIVNVSGAGSPLLLADAPKVDAPCMPKSSYLVTTNSGGIGNPSGPPV